MIQGVHTMVYSSEPDALRAFLRDKLQFPFTDVGEGWLIFDLPEADMGCHPEDLDHGAKSGMQHVSFYCDNIEKTVAELKQRGVEFTGGIEDHGYGLVTYFRVPGNFVVQLYQPRYTKNAKDAKPKKRQTAKPRAVAVSASRNSRAKASAKKKAKK